MHIVELATSDEKILLWNAETASPAAQFRVGQIVKHRKFGYRGVIVGHDQRPSLDMSTWNGIMGLKHGQEQPVYKV